jgi:glucose-6-phosphate dehydrogenase assembly protein OpcA
VLYPRPDDDEDAIEAEVDLRCFASGQRGTICAEVIELHLRGARAAAAASIVEPLLTADLTDFLRWRGDPPFGEPELDQLVAVVDRLVVDSREWREEPDSAFERIPELFERVTVSDIAWARTEPWREAVARLWPGVRDASSVRVAGPRAEALLLTGWLSGRLGRGFALEHEPAGEIELVAVDGEEAVPGRVERKSPSDLLSDQLDIFWRDPIYEEAVRSFSRVPT